MDDNKVLHLAHDMLKFGWTSASADSAATPYMLVGGRRWADHVEKEDHGFRLCKGHLLRIAAFPRGLGQELLFHPALEYSFDGGPICRRIFLSQGHEALVPLEMNAGKLFEGQRLRRIADRPDSWRDKLFLPLLLREVHGLTPKNQ